VFELLPNITKKEEHKKIKNGYAFDTKIASEKK